VPGAGARERAGIDAREGQRKEAAARLTFATLEGVN
jgi:hypothetical protein